ncbi:unnamed protein product [Amaranthus hypochondriacus]
MEYNLKCKNCESAAWIYCTSENVNMCWDCDTITHKDNPSFSEHIRQVLCHKCQSKTVWGGFGPKLPKSMSCCFFCDPKTIGNVDAISARMSQIYGSDDEDILRSPQTVIDLFKYQDHQTSSSSLDDFQISPADANILSELIKSIEIEDIMPPRTIIIEHGNEDPIFNIRAEEISASICLLGDHYIVQMNPMSAPRKGSFVISTNEGPPYICLLDLEQPYDELKNLDKKALIDKIRGL